MGNGSESVPGKDEAKKKLTTGIRADEDWYRSTLNAVGGNSVSCRIRQLSQLFYKVVEKPLGNGLRYEHTLMLGGPQHRLEDFVLLPVVPGFRLKMRVTRVRKGVAGLYPLYYLHLENPSGERQCRIMVAKKYRSLVDACYTISTNPSMKSEYRVGKLVSNLILSEFTLYGGRSILSHAPRDKGGPGALPKGERFKEELAGILHNILWQPIKMTLVIPTMKNLLEMEAVSPKVPKESLLQLYPTEDDPTVRCLRSKGPVWNPETQSYTLNFGGRISGASWKNFQIISDDNVERILLQFGRASENTFVLDFEYPFSPLQAFGIALSKLGWDGA